MSDTDKLITRLHAARRRREWTIEEMRLSGTSPALLALVEECRDEIAALMEELEDKGGKDLVNHTVFKVG